MGEKKYNQPNKQKLYKKNPLHPRTNKPPIIKFGLILILIFVFVYEKA